MERKTTKVMTEFSEHPANVDIRSGGGQRTDTK